MRARNEKMIVSHDARDTYTDPFSMHYKVCPRQSTAPPATRHGATKRRALYLDRVSLKDQQEALPAARCGCAGRGLTPRAATPRAAPPPILYARQIDIDR